MDNTIKKGRPSQISQEKIVECALKLGFQNTSMHAVAKQLGVSATALYRYVNSKEELVLLCCDHIIAKVTLHDEKDWEKYLYKFAFHFRAVLLSIPGSVSFIRYNQQFTPASSALTDHTLGIFREAQFEAETGFMAFASVYTRVTDIVEHQEQADSYCHDNTEGQKADTKKFPNLAWLLKTAKPVDYDKYFEDGIKVTIEGLKIVFKK